MSLLVGQPITGEDVEQLTSNWPVDRFASMCDALAWSASGKRFVEMPSFTSRVFAPDGGIDAEWHITLPQDEGLKSAPLVGAGWNVFQYKHRDILASNRSSIISKLKSKKSGVKDVIAEIKQKHGKSPDRYVLFLNVDLTGVQMREIKEAILTGSNRDQTVHVEIVDAAGLAALSNDHPHLRATYFSPQSFHTWQNAYEAHQSRKLFGSDVEFVGRRQEIDQIHSFLNSRESRVLIVAGPHDIGKTRLVLECTRGRPHDVVVSLDSRSMTSSDLRRLTSEKSEIVCIIEDPEIDSVESFILEALSTINFKLILTVPTPSFALSISYGLEKRIQILSLDPLDYDVSRNLLTNTGHHLDFEVAEWIIEHSHGYPGIILAAASIGVDLRRGAKDFLKDIGKAFEGRICRELGDESLKAAELFSFMTHVGISGEEFESELRSICEVFGDGWKASDALRQLDVLEDAGLAKRGGSFASLSLSALGNYLVKKKITGRKQDLFALYGKLNEQGRMRFLRRLSEIEGPEVDTFWDEFFGENGPLGDFDSAIGNLPQCLFLAGAQPERMIRLLESGLLMPGDHNRTKIKDENRHELKWVLEQLLFNRKTCRRAIKIIWLLAETGAEDEANVFLELLKGVFHPFHNRVPLTLNERLRSLKEFTSGDVSSKDKIAAIRVAGDALGRGYPLIPHGPLLMHPEEMPVITYGEVDEYIGEIIGILKDLADDCDTKVAHSALGVLPQLVSEFGIQCRPGDARKIMQDLVEWVLSGKEGLDASSIFRAINDIYFSLSEEITKGVCPEERVEEVKSEIALLEDLREKLDKGGYLLRLKRWAGDWSLEDHEDISVEGRDIPRYELELKELAAEALNDKALLNKDVLDWLVSEEAVKSRTYFFYLGKKDTKGVFRETIERLGKAPDGRVVFSSYWWGWGKNDPKGAEDRLDALALSNEFPGHTIVQATVGLPASQKAVHRIKQQIISCRIETSLAGEFLADPWADNLNSGPMYDLLKSVAGKNLEHASTAIYVLRRRRHANWALEGPLEDFAWRCLETDPIPDHYAHESFSDELAAELTRKNAERGFGLLRKLLSKKRDPDHWDPLSGYGRRHRFWDELYNQDPERLLKLVFDSSLTDPGIHYRILYALRGLLDLEDDMIILKKLAKESEETAELISGSIVSSQPGFRHLAEQLVCMYPDNGAIRGNLASGIEGTERVIVGTFSDHFKRRKAEVDQWRKSPDVPFEVRTWLREVSERLEENIRHHVVWEYDEDVNDLRRHIEDKESPQRIWAIGRMLKYGELEDWRRFLTLEDIEEAWSLVDLPERKRNTIERAMKVWRNGI